MIWFVWNSHCLREQWNSNLCKNSGVLRSQNNWIRVLGDCRAGECCSQWGQHGARRRGCLGREREPINTSVWQSAALRGAVRRVVSTSPAAVHYNSLPMSITRSIPVSPPIALSDSYFRAEVSLFAYFWSEYNKHKQKQAKMGNRSHTIE